MTTIAPLEYVVIRIQHDQFTREILPALTAIQQAGNVRVVDLLFVAKNAHGVIVTREIHELGEEDLQPFAELADDLQGLLTVEDIATLAADVPVGESAVIVMLEHCWAQELGHAVGRAGGTVLSGGLVPADTLARVNLELAAVPA